MYIYYISRNKESTITVTNADFSWMNPNDILVIAVHLRDHQTNESSIGAYNSTIIFLKDYIAKFFRSDVEVDHIFGTENQLAKITTELPKALILTEGPIEEPELDYIYLKKKLNQKEFFRVMDKHLVPTKIL